MKRRVYAEQLHQAAATTLVSPHSPSARPGSPSQNPNGSFLAGTPDATPVPPEEDAVPPQPNRLSRDTASSPVQTATAAVEPELLKPRALPAAPLRAAQHRGQARHTRSLLTGSEGHREPQCRLVREATLTPHPFLGHSHTHIPPGHTHRPTQDTPRSTATLEGGEEDT